MGIFSRMKDIASSNISEFKEKREDNDKNEDQINEYITQRAVELADIKKSAAELIANEVKLERQCEECQSQIERFEGLAKKALAAGSEEDARAFLKKKHELEKQKSDLTQRHAEAKQNADRIKETYNSMVREINELQTRLKLLKGREAAADAQNTLNKGCNNEDIEQAFTEWETDADKKQAEADAEAYSSDDDELSKEIAKLRKELDK